VVHDFHFQSGETLPEVKLHYYTLGKPVKDANGRTANAVLILHSTSGQGSGFLRLIFAEVLFGPRQLLDVSKYYVIIPDNVVHGKSSKLSDGLHGDFLYAVSASRDYDPSAKLESIQATLMFVNSADDFINSPELGIAGREIKRVTNGEFVVLPAWNRPTVTAHTLSRLPGNRT
jgi:pimeloyl-ACP methyl ester carboxylesterase